MLTVLSRLDHASPALVWYGPDDERVELSGRVLTNWVIKAANLLHLECDVAPGDPVDLALPAHWRLVVWALGCWAVEAEPRLEDHGRAEVLVTTAPEAGAAAVQVAVPLPALAMSWPGTLPSGALDGAAELMGQPDAPIFAGQGTPVPAGVAHERRPLVVATAPAVALLHAVGALRAGTGIVLAAPGLGKDLSRLAEQEHAVLVD